MPPSQHPSGRVYHSSNQGAVVEAPAWLLELLAAGPKRDRLPDGVGATGGRLVTKNRNTYLTRRAGALRRIGSTEESILCALTALNNDLCSPSLSDREVADIARKICRYQPALCPSDDQLVQICLAAPLAMPQTRSLVAVSMADVELKSLEWLWGSWIPLGNLTSLEADGGVGKTTVMYDIIARLTQGWPMPDGPNPLPPSPVVVLSCEDDTGCTVKPRLEAAGADLSKILYVEQAEDSGQSSPIKLPTDAALVEDLVAKSNARLLLIDPILAFAEGDYCRGNDVRKIVEPLRGIAMRHNCAVVFIRHWNKSSASGKASYRGEGSTAWFAAARSQFIAGPEPNRQGRYILAWSKGNLAPPPSPLSYSLEGCDTGVARVVWHGPSHVTADQVAAQIAPRYEDGAELAEAAEMLTVALASGPVPMTVLRADFAQVGVPWQAAVKAKQSLGIRTQTVGGVWMWALAPGA